MEKEIADMFFRWVQNLPIDEQHRFHEEFEMATNISDRLSPQTRANYRRKALLILSGDRHLPDYAKKPRSFFPMRAAMAWHSRGRFYETLMEHRDAIINNQGRNDAAIEAEFITDVRAHLCDIKQIQSIRRKDYLDEHDSKIPRKSKIYSVRALPIGWLDILWKEAANTVPSPDYRDSDAFLDFIALLSLVSPRPIEFSRDLARYDDEIQFRVGNDYKKIRPGDGVVVDYKNGDLVITVAGAKTGPSKGQAWRHITVSIENEQAEHLRDRIIGMGGGPIVIGLERHERLSHWLRKVSERCFPNLENNEHVTGYTFRHMLSSEMKAAEFDEKKAAMVLGEQSADTQQYYGRARLAQGKFWIKDVVAASPVRAKKRKDFSVPLSLKPIHKK